MESLIIILKNFALAFFGLVLFVLFYLMGIHLGIQEDPFARNTGF